MPWLSAKVIRSTRRATEDVIGYDTPRNKEYLVIEEHVNAYLEWLNESAMNMAQKDSEWVTNHDDHSPHTSINNSMCHFTDIASQLSDDQFL